MLFAMQITYILLVSIFCAVSRTTLLCILGLEKLDLIGK